MGLLSRHLAALVVLICCFIFTVIADHDCYDNRCWGTGNYTKVSVPCNQTDKRVCSYRDGWDGYPDCRLDISLDYRRGVDCDDEYFTCGHDAKGRAECMAYTPKPKIGISIFVIITAAGCSSLLLLLFLYLCCRCFCNKPRKSNYTAPVIRHSNRNLDEDDATEQREPVRIVYPAPRAPINDLPAATQATVIQNINITMSGVADGPEERLPPTSSYNPACYPDSPDLHPTEGKPDIEPSAPPSSAPPPYNELFPEYQGNY